MPGYVIQDMIHGGRAFVGLIVVGLVILLEFGVIGLPGFLSLGAINISLPVSALVLTIILVMLYIFDFSMYGGQWTPIYPLIFGTLIFQNWLVGLSLAAVNLALQKTLGRTGVYF